MNLLDNHVDCLHVTKYLIKMFEARRDEIQEKILGKDTIVVYVLYVCESDSN